MREIKALTGIRGVAAIYVVLYHFTDAKIPFLWNGYLAVDLFFVLSGFIMCMVYCNKFKSSISIDDVGAFLWHRFARIYPLYFFILLFMISLHVFKGKAIPINQIIINFLMWQNLFNHGMVGAAWSVSVELIAYIIFPFMFYLLSKHKAISFLVFYVSISTLFYLTTINNPYGSGPLDVSGILPTLMRGVCGFSIGVCFYVLSSHYSVLIKKIRLIQDATAILMILSLSIKGLDIVFVILTGIYVSTLYYGEGVTSRFLSSKPVHFIGELSFSIYLTHLIFHRNLHEEITTISSYLGGSNNIQTAIKLAMTIVTSIFTYYVIENPFRKILRKIK